MKTVILLTLFALATPNLLLADSQACSTTADSTAAAVGNPTSLDWMENDGLQTPTPEQRAFPRPAIPAWCSSKTNSYCTYSWDAANACCYPVWVAPNAYCPWMCQ